MNVPKMIEQDGQRVLTTAQLAEAYGTSTQRISHNFSQNKKRYVEGKHFYYLTGESLKEFAMSNFDTANKGGKMYLWTERGALLHAKSLNTDKAWEVYDFLVEHYFRAKTGFEALLDFDADTEMQKLRQQKKRAAELQEYYELSADVSICKAKADVANAKLNAFLTAHPWLINSVNVPLLAKEEPPCPT